MSYEPTLIINVEQFNDAIPFFGYSKAENYLIEILNQHKKHRIGGVLVVICRPEGTSFSREVRHALTRGKVQFWEDD